MWCLVLLCDPRLKRKCVLCVVRRDSNSYVYCIKPRQQLTLSTSEGSAHHTSAQKREKCQSCIFCTYTDTLTEERHAHLYRRDRVTISSHNIFPARSTKQRTTYFTFVSLVPRCRGSVRFPRCMHCKRPLIPRTPRTGARRPCQPDGPR